MQRLNLLGVMGGGPRGGFQRLGGRMGKMWNGVPSPHRKGCETGLAAPQKKNEFFT